MSDLVIIPSVDQINLEYRLAQNKAGEAVQHAVNCGLMLLQVKASLAHGQWLPWLEAQRENGAIEFTDQTASKYMRIASNRNHGFNLIEAPSIRAALELLTEDKPDRQAGLELETAKERQAREAAEERAKQAEAKAQIETRRAEEFRMQDNAKGRLLKEKDQLLQTSQAEAASMRKTIALEAEKLANAKQMELQAELNKAKAEAVKRAAEVKSLKREREEAIQRGVANKLRDQQAEIDAKEGQLVAIEKRIAFLKNDLEPLNSAKKFTAHHKPRIAKVDNLINAIAVEISDAFDPDLGPDIPPELLDQWERGARKISQLQDMIHLAINGGSFNG